MATKAPINRYIDKTSDCWLWTGGISPNGYGKYRKVSAHRAAYEIFVGPIAEGMQLDHLCRVRHCVNPKHLEPVTPKENIRRGLPYRGPNMGGEYQLAKTHCRRGHEYNEKNTSIRTRKNGNTYRECRTCRREHY